MAPCEGCPLRPGDWCSRLSWPGIPVTSFQWGRMVTINVSPGGAASPAREDAPRCRRPAVLRADNRPQGPSRTHPIPTRSLRADSRLLDPSPAHPDIVPPRLTLGHLTLGTVTGAPHRCPVTPCLGVADPRGPSRTHLAVVLQRLVRATGPKFRRGHVPVAPCVRTAEPWIRRRRIPPSSCHSLRTDNRARASSRTHLRRRVRPPRAQTARLQVRPRVPGTPTRQTPATDGDIPRGRVRVLPGGGIRRRQGQQSRPRTRRMPPAAQKCPRTRRTSPATAPECGASVASRATGAPTTPAPTSNHDLRAPHRRQKRPSRGRRDRLQARKLPDLRWRLQAVG